MFSLLRFKSIFRGSLGDFGPIAASLPSNTLLWGKIREGKSRYQYYIIKLQGPLLPVNSVLSCKLIRYTLVWDGNEVWIFSVVSPDRSDQFLLNYLESFFVCQILRVAIMLWLQQLFIFTLLNIECLWIMFFVIFCPEWLVSSRYTNLYK